MAYEFYPIVFFIVLLFGLLGLGILKKALRDREAGRLRELLHRERMKAMEKEIPLTEFPPIPELEPRSAGSNRDWNDAGVRWVRFLALLFGLTLLFAGLGFCLAFGISTDPETQKLWPIGLIPAMMGIGMLIFHRLSPKTVAGGAESRGLSPLELGDSG